MAQIGSDGHAFKFGGLLTHTVIRCQRQVERERRADAAFLEGENFHCAIRQHGDFIARHIHRREPFARDRIEIRTRRNAQGGCGDVDAQAVVAIVQFNQREGIIDFGRGFIVDTEGGNVSERQIGWRDTTSSRRKSRAFGKPLA